MSTPSAIEIREVSLHSSKSPAPQSIPTRALKVDKGDAETATGRGGAQGRSPLHDAAPQPQCDRTARYATLGWQGDTLVIYDASQLVSMEAATIAEVFGLKPEQVHVTSPYVGGGFRRQMTLWDHQIIGAAAAKLVGRPVRIALSREGVYRIVGGRTVTEQRVAIGADARRQFHRYRPHRHGGDDQPQQHARAVHRRHQGGLCRRRR